MWSSLINICIYIIYVYVYIHKYNASSSNFEEVGSNIEPSSASRPHLNSFVRHGLQQGPCCPACGETLRETDRIEVQVGGRLLDAALGGFCW